MVQQYLEVLYDPASFFEREAVAGSAVVPIVAAVLVGLVSGVAAWMSTQRTVRMMSGNGGGGMGGFGSVVGAISLVVALVMPFVAWLLYAGTFHLVTAFLGGDGEFKTTLIYTGWGFLPKILGAVASLATTWVVMQAVSPPAEVTQQSMQAYQQAVKTHPATLAGTLVGVLVLGWSAYIWVGAVEAARDVDRADAAIAVGIPVAIALIIRLGSQYLL
jgi:hypothetical protein